MPIDLTTPKLIGVAMIVHEVRVERQIFSLKKVKPAVRSSIKRKNRVLDHFQTPVDENGENNPSWNCLGDLVVNSTASTVKTDFLALEVRHHGRTGKRLIGQATVTLELLMEGDGIRREVSYPMFRSDEYVGQIIVSHEVREVQDLISANPVVGETSSNGTTTQGAGDGPPRQQRRPFRVPSVLSSLADCFSVFENAADMGELIPLI